MCIDYENELIRYINIKTNISEKSIHEVISCYKICTEEDINEEPNSSYDNIRLLTGFNQEIIKTIMKSMSNFEEEIL